ncbi:MAG TPA: 2-C-methyl-D-erythritol 4-phosphate cytidylyltransferase [Bacteroidales bacterium]|nr:2-C-methyl-D-erythritol 4-phosphate cytidylyltransferase [Bacteroidales bacterium]
MQSVVIVGGGTGTRMNSATPKQFIEILGKEVIIWTIERFYNFDPDIKIILVLPESHLIIWQPLKVKYPFLNKVITTTGGASRFHSVKQGLLHVKPDEIVGIHDAVRPLVSMETLKRCYDVASYEGSAVPVIDSEDSLRQEIGEENEVIDRTIVKRVQTPQVFKAEKILTAYENGLEKKYTDDASVYESYFGKVNLVTGNQENIKITFPGDLKIAEALLRKEEE